MDSPLSPSHLHPNTDETHHQHPSLHDSDLSYSQGSTNDESFTSTELPSQLTITDLDPPFITHHHALSTTQDQPTINTGSSISSSLHRRLLAVSSSQRRNPNQTQHLESEWRRSFFDQMNQDFQTGLNQSQAVSRLRQRMNQLRASHQSSPTTNYQQTTNPTEFQPSDPSPSLELGTSHFGSRDLVSNLHQVRSQRYLFSCKVNSHFTYLLYCGSNSDQEYITSSIQDSNTPVESRESRSGNSINNLNRDSNHSFGDHRGCGKLITIRATLMTRKPARGCIFDQVMGDSYSSVLRRSASEQLLLTSDSNPLPDSVDRVDDLTQNSFENDASNLFHRGSPNGLFCSCQKTYLGCLACGNIVGHTVIAPCRQCQTHSTLDTHFYYLNRLTAIPRYINASISLELQNCRVPDEFSNQKIMSWTQALLSKKSDIEAGYVGNHMNCRPRSSATIVLTDSLDDDPSVRLSERVRNAILLGSVDSLLDCSTDITNDNSRAYSPSSFNPTVPTLSENQPHGPILSLASFPRSSVISLNSSSNRLFRSATNDNRLRRVGLTRRPAIRISHHSGIRSATSSRSTVRPSFYADPVPGSWFPHERPDLRPNEHEVEMEIKEREEGLDNSRSGNSRRQRKDDDDDDDVREEASTSISDQQDLIEESLNQRESTNNNTRVSRRAVRRRIHRDLDGQLPGFHLDDQVNDVRVRRFSSNFNWSGDVCAR